MEELDIAFATSGSDPALAQQLTDLINEVYLVAEAGLWLDGTARTSAAEIAGLIERGEMMVARSGGRVVGVVRVHRLATGEAEFGMLAADPAYRGLGIGRELVRFAEDSSRQAGVAIMQLELLMPRQWKHPAKERLHDWYTRIGYRAVRAAPIGDSYPELGPLLATPCDLHIFHKEL